MKTWTVVLLVWIAPALLLLAALVRANIRRSNRRRHDGEAAKAAPKTESSPAK